MEIANVESFENWNGESGERWSEEADRRDRVLAPIADSLLDSATLRTGESVLDVGCGCGATTLAAAARVGSGGSALGLDLSAPMLDVARDRAAARGIENVSFVQGDAQVHALPSKFNAAVSRFGTMFFTDPVAAFSNVAASVHPNGRICFATWQPLAANEWLMVPGAALLRYGSLPRSDRNAPGMFAQSEPDVVSGTLTEAGFAAVELEPVTLSLTLGSDVNDAATYLACSGIGRVVLETVPEVDKQAALDAVRDVLRERADVEGVHLNAAVWIVHAALR